MLHFVVVKEVLSALHIWNNNYTLAYRDERRQREKTSEKIKFLIFSSPSALTNCSSRWQAIAYTCRHINTEIKIKTQIIARQILIMTIVFGGQWKKQLHFNSWCGICGKTNRKCYSNVKAQAAAASVLETFTPQITGTSSQGTQILIKALIAAFRYGFEHVFQFPPPINEQFECKRCK